MYLAVLAPRHRKIHQYPEPEGLIRMGAFFACFASLASARERHCHHLAAGDTVDPLTQDRRVSVPPRLRVKHRRLLSILASAARLGMAPYYNGVRQVPYEKSRFLRLLFPLPRQIRHSHR